MLTSGFIVIPCTKTAVYFIVIRAQNAASPTRKQNDHVRGGEEHVLHFRVLDFQHECQGEGDRASQTSVRLKIGAALAKQNEFNNDQLLLEAHSASSHTETVH